MSFKLSVILHSLIKFAIVFHLTMEVNHPSVQPIQAMYTTHPLVTW